jgi:hypothetical protein
MYSRIVSAQTPFPDQYTCSLVYYENSGHADLGTVTIISNQTYTLNNPYDPYSAIGGKSANLFVQIMSMYRYCRVLAADVEIKYTDDPAANSCPIQTALVYNSEGVSYASMDDIISLPTSKRVVQLKMTGRIGNTLTLRGRFFPAMSFYMDESQWHNLPAGSPYDITNIGGIVSPVNKAELDFYFAKVNKANVLTVANPYTITINYICHFYDRQSFTE